MKIPVIIPLLLLKICFAQTIPKKISTYDLLFTGNHYSFGLTTYLSNKATISNYYGPYQMKSSFIGGLELGFNLHSNFDNNSSFITGLGIGTSGRNYLLKIPKEDFNPPRDYDYIDNGAISREFDFYLSAPVLFEWRFKNTPQTFWNVVTGINIRYSISNFDEGTTTYINDNNNQQTSLLQMNLNVGNNAKPWLNYNLGGGYNWILKNNNIIKVNLLLNYSFTKVVNGSYMIKLSGQQISGGDYSVDQSYLGIRIHYVFTEAEKRLKKLNRRNFN